MKTKTINLYTFDELTDEAKAKAIDGLYNINVDHEWWDYIYEDAERIGLKIEEFDTDHYCKGYLEDSLFESCEKIKKEHGEQCDTYKLAQSYLSQWAELVKRYSDGVNLDEVMEGNEYAFDEEADELEREFEKALCEEYRIMLRKEYDHLTSVNAIIETIQANEYTFTEDGKLENV